MRRSLILALVFVVLQGSPALANHEPPHDGPHHHYGDMVDYPLTFPVVGEYWYEDWFWAARGSGSHHAQDIMTAKMTPVVAAASGTITYYNWSQDPDDLNEERCCALVVEHEDGWMTWYIHLNNDTPGTDDGQGWGIAPEISLGTHVEAGDLLGWVGDSGTAENTAPHLHFELYDPDWVLVNPFDSLLASEGRPFCSITRVGDVSALLAGAGLLKPGSSGTSVEQLQAFLEAFRNDPGPVDGIFGPLTTTAVRTFQAWRGLTVDGIVGSITRQEVANLAEWAAHASVLDPDGRHMSMGARGGDVAELQGLLKVVGFDAGTPDGIFGSRTTGAVRAFQESHGILIDGVVGRGTRTALAADLGLSALVSCP
jgi:peptidoglycan hydrolase-like protein with peptidoglycan-binding domain